ncbi:MAG TPA: POTRA domain-containing protein [Terriglobales bacterium]|nr:POTRA domain-containing protein [Terriglobales bacterium]
MVNGRIGWAAVLAALLSLAAAAQGPPSAPPATQAAGAAAVQQGAKTTRDFEQLQKQLGRRDNPTQPEITPPTTAATGASAAGASFELDHIVTTASAILSPAEITHALAPYHHRQVTLADLNRAVAALNALYREKGVLTARAVLPRQQVEGGVVRIELIEARLDQVRVLGARQTAASFYRDRIHATTGDLVRLPELKHDLILLNTGNDVTARALLAPGRRFGTTDLVIQVQEPPLYSLQPTLDDSGRSSIGLRRIGLSLRQESLLGYRDAFTVASTWAMGTFSQMVAYSLPLNTLGTRLTMGADFSGIRIRAGQLQSLGITGNSLDFHLDLSHPLLARAGLVLSGTAGYQVTRSLTRSNAFPLSRELVQAVNLGVNLQAFDGSGVWLATGMLSFGSGSLAGHHGFGKETLALAREQRLWPGYTNILRLTGQSRLFAPTSGLPLVEQMQVGGLATVRGYGEGWQIADTGYAFTDELDYPLPLRQYFFGGAFSRGLEGAVFADHGGIFGVAGPQRDLYLTSAGLGVVFNSPYLSGRLDWAAPLENRAGLPKVGFDFYLQPRIPSGWLHLPGAGR